jgi:hypothetical protein
MTPNIQMLGLAGVMGLLLILQTQCHRAEEAERERDAARNNTVVATAQGDLNQSAAEAVQAAQTREVSITVQAERYADAVAAAPGGDGVVPPGVLDSWRAGIESFREPTP